MAITSTTSSRVKKLIGALIILSLVIILCFCALGFIYSLQDASLQNTWQSEETGRILTFTEDEYVEFKENSSKGIYHILSPNTMEYTINGKTFKMNYYIEENKLYWGIDQQHMECFSRKWL